MDYLDKFDIGSTRNPERNSHQILSNAKSFFLLKMKTNTYSVSEQKDTNRHGPSKQFGPKLQLKIKNKKEHIWHGLSN